MMRSVAGLLAVLLPVAAHGQAAGRWEGTYTCAQGDTALALTVRDAPAPDVRAVFQFFALDANPEVPDGCFTMSGRYDAGARTLSLAAGDWLLRPANYVTVDLLGAVSADGQSLSGTVLGPGCTTFALRRTGPAGAPAATCRGGVVAGVR